MVSYDLYCLTQVCSLPQVGEGERGGGEDEVGVLQPDDCAGHRHQRMQGHQAGSRGTQGQSERGQKYRVTILDGENLLLTCTWNVLSICLYVLGFRVK